HADVQLQAERAARGGQGRDGDEAARAQVELRAAPDLARQELDDVLLEVRADLLPGLPDALGLIGAQHFFNEPGAALAPLRSVHERLLHDTGRGAEYRVLSTQYRADKVAGAYRETVPRQPVPRYWVLSTRYSLLARPLSFYSPYPAATSIAW